MSTDPAFYFQYVADDNVADLLGPTLAATYRGDETEGLQAIVSEADGGIIAYAIGLAHAGQIVAALNAAEGDDEDEDEDGPPPGLNIEGDPTRNGAFALRGSR